jgi:hypothetical protein
MRLKVLYILTVLFFPALFILTMLIDNQDLYLGYGSDWYEVKTNNKIPIQGEIFVYGILIVLLTLNWIEKLIYSDSKFKTRIIKALITIITIYIFNFFLYNLIDKDNIFCMFYHPRVNPILGFFFSLILYHLILQFISELIFRTKYFIRIRNCIKNIISKDQTTGYNNK